LGIDTLLGANWGSQTYTHRIREEREGATCQHLIGPPQHVNATCQRLIGPPHPCGSRISDKWIPLMPRGSTSLVHLTQPMPRDRILFNPVRSLRDTWQTLIGPHHRPHQHSRHLAACEWSTAARRGAKWQHTEKPPQICVPHDTLLLVHLSHVGPTTTLT
jgi:hypothetical protein